MSKSKKRKPQKNKSPTDTNAMARAAQGSVEMPARRGPGQPTKYKPEFCELLIKHMEGGLSFECFGAIVHCSTETCYEWARVHPEFSDAKKEGEVRARLFWESVGRAGMTGKIAGFQNAVWIFSMKNRFRWKDRHELEHTGKDGGPIASKTEVGLSDEAADFLRKRVLGVKSEP